MLSPPARWPVQLFPRDGRRDDAAWGRDYALGDLSSEVPPQKQHNKIQTWQRATVYKIMIRGKEPHSFWPGAACGSRAACSPPLLYPMPLNSLRNRTFF